MNNQNTSPSGEKKVIYIIAHQDFRDEEYFEPKKLLTEAGYEVVTASTEKTPAKGKLGGSAEIDVTINQINADDYAAIILAGGSGARNYIGDTAINQLLMQFKSQNKLIAAICIAPTILAKAGILENKNFTVHDHGIDLVAPLIPEQKSVVVDTKLITANGPAASAEFAQSIITYLNSNN